MEKTCSQCKEVKSETDFYPRTGRQAGTYQAECKICWVKRTKKWQKENPEKYRAIVRESMRIYRRKLRERTIAFLGGSCVRCGTTDIRVLEIDHINGGGSEENRRIGNPAVHRKILSGASGYQILCANDHAIKTYEVV